MRRHLHYSPAEVDAMPWWELKMWAEKLLEEFSDETEAAPTGKPSELASLDDLAGLGVNVRRLHAVE